MLWKYDWSIAFNYFYRPLEQSGCKIGSVNPVPTRSYGHHRVLCVINQSSKLAPAVMALLGEVKWQSGQLKAHGPWLGGVGVLHHPYKSQLLSGFILIWQVLLAGIRRFIPPLPIAGCLTGRKQGRTIISAMRLRVCQRETPTSSSSMLVFSRVSRIYFLLRT